MHECYSSLYISIPNCKQGERAASTCRGNCVLLQVSRYLAIKFQRGQNLIAYLGWQGNLGLRRFDSTILFIQGFRDFLFFQLEELNFSHLFQPFSSSLLQIFVLTNYQRLKIPHFVCDYIIQYLVKHYLSLPSQCN